MELMHANRQWSTRPDEERYLSLTGMQAHFDQIRAASRSVIVPSKVLSFEPTDDESHKGLVLTGPNGHAYAPSHWAFGQIASLAGAPAGYLRSLPAPMAADCLNYGLQIARQGEDVGCLLYRNGGAPMMRAATGPTYGRIWNAEVTKALVDRVGDGTNGDWRIPGEFGRTVPVTKENTTLYASDRDMFVFLADERRRIELPARRGGKPGSLARGFFVWNSEVGAATFGLATFLFDYVCSNRIVWGATQYREIKVRHTAAAPDRFLREIAPALRNYAHSSAAGVTLAIEDARRHRLPADGLQEFLAKRFSKTLVPAIVRAHEAEEGRPIESRWDAIVGATAAAKALPHQNERVALERQAGALLDA